jgi:DNA polymerase-1
MTEPVVVDFETEKLLRRPHYPPKPIGVSIGWPGKAINYRAWGHASGNNCDQRTAVRELEAAWKHPGGVLFHHAKFDLDVAETHLGLAPPPDDQVEDTMFEVFLHSPDDRSLGLKPQAFKLLDMPPDEKDDLWLWFLQHQPVVDGVRLTKGGKNSFMNYLQLAPGLVVGGYANGDVKRTKGLHKFLRPKVASMRDAYRQEIALIKVFLQLERQGLRVDTERLVQDVLKYEQQLEWLDARIGKYLQTPNLNLNASADLAEALLRSGKAKEEDFLRTAPTGRHPDGVLSTNKESMKGAVKDVQLRNVLRHRGMLKTYLSTFMRSWRDMALETGGYVYTHWNQTKNAEDGDDESGTRTGRPSCTWFLNTPKEAKPLFRTHANDNSSNLPAVPVWCKQLEPLPIVRSYVVPYRANHILGDRDYNQQEPRILAHFEGGALLQSYQRDPWIDFHTHVQQMLAAVGLHYHRDIVKPINLGLIYGKGTKRLAEETGLSIDEARDLKKAIMGMYPGLDDMYREMKRRAKEGEPIRTWGGRYYYCEEPLAFNGRWITFDYKMVNTLVQGSAADCTKKAMLNYMSIKKDDHVLLLQVYDQMLASFPERDRKRGMALLKQAMEDVQFDLPMFSDGKMGHRWGQLREYDKKGVITYKEAA